MLRDSLDALDMYSATLAARARKVLHNEERMVCSHELALAEAERRLNTALQDRNDEVRLRQQAEKRLIDVMRERDEARKLLLREAP